MLRTAILAAILAATGTCLVAQDLRNDLIDIGPPAEFPPDSYGERQYVDSRGCVYVRTGAIGQASWVPRVTGNRKVLCGFRPTQVARTAPPVIPDPAPRVAETAPASTPRVVRTPTPRVTASAPVAQTAPLRPKSYRAARNGPAARLAAEPIRRSVATQPRRAVVKAAAAPRATVSAPDSSAALVPGERIAVPAAPAIRTPPGYRKAWDDGRLNPDRGKQTLRGALQTALVWTQTVPRRLKTADGRDVTNTYRYLVYPYTDYDKQLSDLRGGKFIVVRTSQGRQIVPTASLRQTASGQTVLSSKSGADPKAASATRQQATVARYVQVGTFGDAANAQRTARNLQAAGLPVRLSAFERGGKRYNIVLAGPFGDADAVRRGLQIARSKGFRDAFVR